MNRKGTGAFGYQTLVRMMLCAVWCVAVGTKAQGVKSDTIRTYRIGEVVVTGSNHAVGRNLLPYTVSTVGRPQLEATGQTQLLSVSAADNSTLPEKYTMTYGNTVRTYRMYIPSSAGDGAPLVVYTHGYGSKTRWRNDLNAVADSCGFAVCYPDGMPDSRGNDSWKVGYPSQECMVIDEADFFRHLLDEVTSRFSLSRVNVFMAGWSNGGDLCYQFAYTAPALFRAYGSVGGLTFEEMYKNNALTAPVPFLEIHGNADEFSMWQGDHLNTGGWSAYIPVPLAVAALAANNRCTTMEIDTFPAKCDASRPVKRTTYGGAPSGCDVIVYEIEGGKHSWADRDVDTSKILWNFFSRYIVNEN